MDYKLVYSPIELLNRTSELIHIAPQGCKSCAKISQILKIEGIP